MRRFLLILGLAAIVVVAGAVVYLMWDLDWRWRPHTVTQHQAEIAQALDQSGWVSPHLTGPKVYVILYPGCAPCDANLPAAIPKLQAADVDTRMIVIARADKNGQALSTPQDRALTAELWTNRSWKLFQQMEPPVAGVPTSNPPAMMRLPVIPPADGDAARSAVIEVGRQMATTLTGQLRDNGVDFDYPTLIWWTKDGKMRACACTSPQSFGFVEKELGA
ncbi:MAG TPA: hypothetical protein VKQ70_02960 [Caulobacteraceae bacterium]|jgi:hypothetical protein|nr:hypothetical protein [Caulobacteraceae bacterium]